MCFGTDEAFLKIGNLSSSNVGYHLLNVTTVEVAKYYEGYSISFQRIGVGKNISKEKQINILGLSYIDTSIYTV